MVEQEAVAGADVLVFCVPHQFAHGVCKELRAVVSPGTVAISLTKVTICSRPRRQVILVWPVPGSVQCTHS